MGFCQPIASLDIPVDEQGLPIVSECSKHDFIKMYNSPEVASAFEALYANENGVQEKFMDYWTVVASFFKDNKHVIGYDILNEPWPANLYHEIKYLLEPHLFDKEKLFPLAKKANDTIRKVDENKIIFFEPA